MDTSNETFIQKIEESIKMFVIEKLTKKTVAIDTFSGFSRPITYRKSFLEALKYTVHKF